MFLQVIDLDPAYADAYTGFGNTQLILGYPTKHASVSRKLLPCNQDAPAHYCLGMWHQRQQHFADAFREYQKALTLLAPADPSAAATATPPYFPPAIDQAQIHCQLGSLFQDQGRIAEALAHFREARARQPGSMAAQQSLLMALHYSSDTTAEQIASEHLSWQQRIGLASLASPTAHPNDPDPERKLRVGYVSADFKTHSVACFLEPLLRAHDRQQLEIYCYVNNPRSDDTTKRFQALADHWRPIVSQSDQELAAHIRHDRIDLLVDCSGHTKGNRLLAFALKPAPIQLSYLGYPATTGLSTMDGRIVDRWTDPVALTEHLHSEHLIRLPHGFLCFSTPSPLHRTPGSHRRHPQEGIALVASTPSPKSIRLCWSCGPASSRRSPPAGCCSKTVPSPIRIPARPCGNGLPSRASRRNEWSWWAGCPANKTISTSTSKWMWAWTPSPTTAPPPAAKPSGWECR